MSPCSFMEEEEEEEATDVVLPVNGGSEEICGVESGILEHTGIF